MKLPLLSLFILLVLCGCQSTDDSGNRSDATSAVGPTTAASPIYLIRDLDTPPLMTEVATPKYPKKLRQQGVPGRVVVEALINSQGKPSKLRILNSTDKRFNAAALDCIRKSKFNPGMLDGNPVSAIVRVPVRFDPGAPPESPSIEPDREQQLPDTEASDPSA